MFSYIPWSPKDSDDERCEDKLSKPKVDQEAEHKGSGLEMWNIEDPFQIFRHDPFTIIFLDPFIRVTHFKGSFGS